MTESLGISKEWRGRRYRGWRRWRRSLRKSWCGNITKWQGQLTKNWSVCCRWSRVRHVETTRPKTGNDEWEMGPFQQEPPREFRRNRGRFERGLPSDVRRQGVSCLDRTVALGSRGWDGRQRKLVSQPFHFWRFFRLSFTRSSSMLVWFDTLSKSWDERHYILPWLHWKAICLTFTFSEIS